MKTLCIEKFFPPSSELTRNVIQRMREHSLRDIQHSIASVERVNPESSDGDELWSELLKASEEEPQTFKEIAADQRWLSEVLYGYMARLPDSQTSPGESYNAVEAIPEGMSNRLGLELDDSKDLELLQQLATEFQQWLAKCPGKEFVAGWGTIWLDPANSERFGLRKFPVSAEQEDELAAAAAGKAFSAGAGSLARSFMALFRSADKV